MRTPVLLSSSTRRLRHTVRVVHASTGNAICGLEARLEPAPLGWSLRTLPDVVVVSARTDVEEPSTPLELVLTLTDDPLAEVLVLPPLAGRPPRTLVAPLTSEVVDVRVHPVPMTLTVVLIAPTTGELRIGRTVTARGRSGPPHPSVALPEVGPGTYRSAQLEWTAALTPADVLVDGSVLRTVAIDLTRRSSTIHLVDTT